MITLDASYARCRELNKAYGTTYYAATFVLPRVKRHHVHALYGFCRYADDIVDDLGPAPVDVREKALTDFGERFFADLADGDSDDPVLKAVVHTVKAFSIDPDCFRRFLRSMTMDLTVARYETFDDLLEYMDGSAAVIGEMMLPILEPSSPAAVPHARDLGIAFQLTNFLRDVSEDIDRGRVYLPQEDLRRFGANPGERRVERVVARAHALRDRAEPRVLRVGRLGDPVPTAGVGALHPGRAPALLGDPRPDRDRGLRRVHPARPRPVLAEGARRLQVDQAGTSLMVRRVRSTSRSAARRRSSAGTTGARNP